MVLFSEITINFNGPKKYLMFQKTVMNKTKFQMLNLRYGNYKLNRINYKEVTSRTGFDWSYFYKLETNYKEVTSRTGFEWSYFYKFETKS